jgi:hypothetical protein
MSAGDANRGLLGANPNPSVVWGLRNPPGRRYVVEGLGRQRARA